MDSLLSLAGYDMTLIVGAVAALAVTSVAIVRDLATSRPEMTLSVEAGAGSVARL